VGTVTAPHPLGIGTLTALTVIGALTAPPGAGLMTALTAIGTVTALVVVEALRGEVPVYLPGAPTAPPISRVRMRSGGAERSGPERLEGRGPGDDLGQHFL
jgi:hypothetical protein